MSEQYLNDDNGTELHNYMVSNDIMDFPKAAFLKRFMEGHPGFIAGGCFKSIFTDSKPHDIDMFFRSREDMARAEKFFLKNDKEYTKGYSNEKVVSYIHNETGIRVELVRKIFGSPEEILDQFDFTIAKFAYEIVGEKVEGPFGGDDIMEYTGRIVYHPKFFEHLTMNRLVVDNNMPYPVSTFNRLFKYAQSGFFPCRETKLKILRAVNELREIADEDLSKALYEGHD